jgi:hypothetical protein
LDQVFEECLVKGFTHTKRAITYWQKGFFDHILRSGESYSQRWDYVRENPVRAGFVTDWREWLFLGEVFDLEFRDHRF